MSQNNQMAELLFGNIDKTPDYYEGIYKKRELSDGAVVTRFAPSPTGFLHIGGLFAAFVSKRAAEATGGRFFLRIEDTDKKREVEGGVSLIVDGLKRFGVTFDEGMISEIEAVGDYGPYIQSARRDIYQCYAKSLVERGLAYPCFMTEEELSEIRTAQEENKLNPGCYGEFAKYRNITFEEAKTRIDAGEAYVVRLKSPGDENKRISFDDGIKGKIEMPENIQDVVILKRDGIPTYHFAHAVDDHLMGTTDVIRGDEWISSVPIHIQFFELLGFDVPKYSHISPIMKEEDGGKRKLSKRKDPEAAVTYYSEMGYPTGAVIEYLLTLANSNFEEWRAANPDALDTDFPFSLAKMSKAGALFDLVKLNDISKNYISRLSADEVLSEILAWSKDYDSEYYNLITKDTDYSKSIFAIERNPIKPRKELVSFSEAPMYSKYFFDEVWDRVRDFPENLDADAMIEILENYIKVYNHSGSAEDWFPQVRSMSEEMGYAKTPKLYKKTPEEFRGHVGDVSSVIRVALTGRRNTPDLYEIMQVLGEEKVMSRFNEAIDILKNMR